VTGNYNDASGSVAIVINKADATLNVSGVTVTYRTIAVLRVTLPPPR
jgi:hypothetical protein